MTRRAVLRTTLVLFVLLGLLTIAFLAFSHRQRTITNEEFLLITNGKSVAEITELLGGPGRQVKFKIDPTQPGKYQFVFGIPARVWVPVEVVDEPRSDWRSWPGEGRMNWVVRFRDGVVEEKIGIDPGVDPGFVARMLRAIGL
jgi:hypothetical protein